MLKRKDGSPLFAGKKKSNVPDNYWGDEVLEEDKTLIEKIKTMSYFKSALAVFALALLLIVIAIIISAGMSGQGNWIVGLLGIIAFGVACYGVWIAIYGHFFVQMDGKKRWLIALVPNLSLALILLIMYISGI